MQKHLRFAIVFSLFLSICFVLHGVTATYAAETPIYLKKSPGIFTHPTVFGAKLGRLTITSSETMYNPTILVTGIDGGYNVVVIGPHRWSESSQWNYDKEINMNVLAVSYPNGLGGPVFIRAVKDKQPLLGGWSNQQVTVSPFYVDIYLVNMNDYGGTSNTGIAANLNTSGGFFKLDSPYIFKNYFNPHFTVGVTNLLSQGPWVFPETGTPTQGQFIPIDDVVGQGTTPILDPTGYTDGEDEGDGFWYGDETPLPVIFNFSLTNTSVYMNLSDAYTGIKEINTAQMMVVNGVEGEKYKQNITFTVAGETNSFTFTPVHGSGPGIDFNLYFDLELVPYGVPITWDDLDPDLNERSLGIGDVDENQVYQRVSDEYHVTIVINITNAD